MQTVNAAYEQAVKAFVEQALGKQQSDPFPDEGHLVTVGVKQVGSTLVIG